MKNLISIFVVAAALCITVQVSADTQRGIRNYQEVLSGRKKIEQLSQEELREVLAVHKEVAPSV